MANVIFTPPIRGIHKGLPADTPAPNTSEYMNNVRAKGLGGRIIIVQRPGLKRWGAPTQVGLAEQPVVAIVTVAAVV
jgi:hypothetical protein